jgi:hypothetical protein
MHSKPLSKPDRESFQITELSDDKNPVSTAIDPAQPSAALPKNTPADTAQSDTDQTDDDPIQRESTANLKLQTTVEHGGRSGPDPVRYGDWEKNGRCIDF